MPIIAISLRVAPLHTSYPAGKDISIEETGVIKHKKCYDGKSIRGKYAGSSVVPDRFLFSGQHAKKRVPHNYSVEDFGIQAQSEVRALTPIASLKSPAQLAQTKVIIDRRSTDGDGWYQLTSSIHTMPARDFPTWDQDCLIVHILIP